MNHSKMIKDLKISNKGISLSPVSDRESKGRETGKQIKQ
jgi:hypothetical protein